MRVEHNTPKTASVVSAADFETDFGFGYVAIEFNPEREVIIRDRRSEREIRRVELADICYRCVDCQFDSLDKKLIEEHREEGNHPWAYSVFKNPYGFTADVEIEGIENYPEYLKQRRLK